MASGTITSWEIYGETVETVTDFIFWAPKSLQIVTAAMKLKNASPWKKSYDQSRQHIKKQRRYFANKGPYSQSYGFFSSHVWMWQLDYKESWAQKNWCFWTVVLEKTLESPLDCKEIQPVHPKGNQSWIFIGRTDAEAETAILWPLDTKNRLEKILMLGKIEGKRRRNDRGWDGWMASPTQWTWIWGNSGSWWWTGRPGMLQFMGLQRVGHDWSDFSSVTVCQTSLSFTNSKSFLKLMSIKLVIPSNHLILCPPLLLLPSIFPIIRVFSNESVLRIR